MYPTIYLAYLAARNGMIAKYWESNFKSSKNQGKVRVATSQKKKAANSENLYQVGFQVIFQVQ